jgi:hypothetical protein
MGMNSIIVRYTAVITHVIGILDNCDINPLPFGAFLGFARWYEGGEETAIEF